jgi:phospholipid/cholesterol/gamma-HCH transport system substrate-binding protein
MARLPRPGLVATVVAALLLVAAGAGSYAFWPREERVRVTGEFRRAVGLFPGSDVRVLGVQVGEVTSVTPKGESVLVEFEFEGKYSVPADAKAAVVAPSLVSDRYVQLFPAYQGGAKMRDGARIGIDRTAVPVELDRISQSLDDLLVALGPKGANDEGAFSRVLATGADNLQGQGQAIHDTNRDLSRALATLQSFTTMLATNDQQVRRLNRDLATVSTQLDGERDDLQAALRNLAVALNEVSTFVKDNRTGVRTGVDRLASVTGTVAKQRDALAETLTNAPVAISNLQNAYNPATGTLDTRANVNENLKLADLLCNLIVSGGQPASLCRTVDGALKPVEDLLAQLERSGVDLPLDLLSAVPAGGDRAATPAGTVQVRGADPSLGGLLEERP